MKSTNKPKSKPVAKKNKHSKIFSFWSGIYPIKYVVAFKSSNGDVIKYLHKEFGVDVDLKDLPDGENSFDGWCGELKDTGIILLLFNKCKKDTTTISMISHEALHAVIQTMDYIGMELDDSSDEAYTYLLGFIVGNIYYNYFEKK